jgi:hypothetical protein
MNRDGNKSGSYQMTGSPRPSTIPEGDALFSSMPNEGPIDQLVSNHGYISIKCDIGGPVTTSVTSIRFELVDDHRRPQRQIWRFPLAAQVHKMYALYLPKQRYGSLECVLHGNFAVTANGY